MEIFYLKKSEFFKSINRESLEYFSDNRKYTSDEKYLEHLSGLFLTKFIAKHFYKISDFKIERRDNKPFFKNGGVFFSISHSKDIVLVAFNNENVGVDVELIRNRSNYKAIMERFGEKIDNPTLEDFYKFWTLYESEIKLNSEKKSWFCSKMEDEYMLACVSDEPLISTFRVQKVVFCGENIDLRDEFEALEKCQFISSVE